MLYKKLKAFEKAEKAKATTSNIVNPNEVNNPLELTSTPASTVTPSTVAQSSEDITNVPSEVTIKQVKEEIFPDELRVFAAMEKILQMFPQEQIELMDKELLLDFAKMAACLTPEAVAKQLNNLSNELTLNLTGKGVINADFSIKKKSNHDYTSNYKVLSKLMEEWAHENGFNHGAIVYCLDKMDEGNRVQILLPPMSPIVFGQLKGSTFRGVLQALGYIFKDLGVSVRHGEFTHFFALYCIVEMNREKNFLKHPVIDLYKKMGGYPYIDYATNRTIWDIIFDSRELISLNTPEVLNDAIRGIYTENAKGFMAPMPVEEMQTLTDVVTGRFIKRSLQMGEKKIVANEAIKKYENMKGLVIDDAILFKNVNSVYFVLDSVESECSYDPSLASIYSFPNIPTEATCIDKILMILDPEESNEKKVSLRKILFTMQKNIQELYQESHSHRMISSYLSKMFIEYSEVLYLQFLINCAQGVLLENDLKPENTEKNAKKLKTKKV